MANIIDKIYDNTKDGVPNYSINLIDGTRLYYRGVVMNPMPNSGDAISYTIMNVKTSANGNQYVGNYKEGRFHGYGVLTTGDGKMYKGTWEMGELVK